MAPGPDVWSGIPPEEMQRGSTPEQAPRGRPAQPSPERAAVPDKMKDITRTVQVKEFGRLQTDRQAMPKDSPFRLNLTDREISMAKRIIGEAVKASPELTKACMDEGSDIGGSKLIEDGKNALVARLFADRTGPMYQRLLRALEQGKDPAEAVEAMAAAANAELLAARRKAMSEREAAARAAEKARGTRQAGPAAREDEPPASRTAGLLKRLFGGKGK